MNGEFIFDGDFVEGMKIRTHAPSSFLHENHDNRGRIGASSKMNNTCL